MITFCISTIKSREHFAVQLAESIASFNYQIIIIIQDSNTDNIVVNNNIEKYYVKGKGLSKSRNLALKHSNEEWSWFLDDDVTIEKSAILRLISVLANTRSEVLIGKISCSDKVGLYKNYDKRKLRTTKLNLLKVSSIEILVKNSFISQSSCHFNESLGLGTFYPSGEENVFMLDLFQKKAKFKWLDEVIILHPCLIPNKSPVDYWNKKGIAFSKGIVARKVGVLLGFALLLRWYIRALPYRKSIPLGYELFSGFFRGNK
jgi:glycosyltransferase involved in cell wall biosynthesis